MAAVICEPELQEDLRNVRAGEELSPTADLTASVTVMVVVEMCVRAWIAVALSSDVWN